MPVGGPAVDRVAPALARGRELVGRGSCDHGRHAVPVELEELGVGPDVGRVVRDVDREVADQPDPLPGAVRAQALPLVEEEVLEGLLDLVAAAELGAGAVDRVGQPAPELLGPVRPGRTAVALLARDEEAVVVEPRRLALDEGREVGRRGLEQSPRRAIEERRPVRPRGREVDPALGEGRERPERVLLEVAVVDEQLRAEQQRVAGERRRARVRRVPELGLGRAERQHLPVPTARPRPAGRRSGTRTARGRRSRTARGGT